MDALVRLLAGKRLAVLTGAGISTESGIPDYRGPETARRARNPIEHRAFVGDPAARRRYWARSVVGWPRVEAARPNPAHHAVADLERAGGLTGVITQNVDGLHQAAGSEVVVDLHGRLADVVCLRCGGLESRASLQRRLLAVNPGRDRAVDAETAPDGDAEVGGADGFHVLGCLRCGGVLKPDVVFFGGNVPRDRVDRATALVDAAEALLVVGSSLTVFSGYRYAKRARETGKPLAIVNLGPTRADPLAAVKVEARAGELLPRLADALSQLA